MSFKTKRGKLVIELDESQRCTMEVVKVQKEHHTACCGKELALTPTSNQQIPGADPSIVVKFTTKEHYKQ